MQAIILAAGMGKRLKELTAHQAKCMVQVNQVPLIERMLLQLEQLNLKQIILVIGHEGSKLRNFVDSLQLHTPVVYVKNSIYVKTNNIYSLFLAREYLLDDDTLLLESDLIFEDAALHYILDNPEPNLALVAKFESWMDGTVVTLNEKKEIEKFLTRKDFRFEDIGNYYKTVNIYKFSRDFSQTMYVPFLEAYCKALGHNAYYEQVLRVISLTDEQSIKACCLQNVFWYEIDDEQDLDIAESIFTDSASRMQHLKQRYGGYWRYPHLLDFCYLVNPYFPNQKLLDEMKANFDRLVTAYPSGNAVNNLLAAKSFGLSKEHVIVGNGAAELIKALLSILNGTTGIIYPTFEEYSQHAADVLPFYPANQTSYGVDDIIEFYDQHSIHNLVLINPDNPSGNYIVKEDLLRLLEWTKQNQIFLIVDESFADFAEPAAATDYFSAQPQLPATLLDSKLLQQNPHLAVIKSISKSYGVPGLRLGIIANCQTELLAKLQAALPIWNINSFGEYFLQIFEKYNTEYWCAMEQFRMARADFYKELAAIHQIHAYPSQANFILCEILDTCSSIQLCEILLNRYNILIKDLSGKKGICKKNMVRIAIRTPAENHLLAEALKHILR